MDIALERLVTVLIIACPHALGLAIPLIVARSKSLGASNGLLTRNRVALEKSKKIKVIPMDKTGTLTEGDFRVSVVESVSEKWSNEEALRLMASLESYSNHPLAIGIMEEAEKWDILFPVPQNVTVISGTGLSGTVEGKQLLIVKPAYPDQQNLSYDNNQYQELARKGNSVSYLIVDNEVAGIVAQDDEIKEEAKTTLGWPLVQEQTWPLIRPMWYWSKATHPTSCIFSHWQRIQPERWRRISGGEQAITSLPFRAQQACWLR